MTYVRMADGRLRGPDGVVFPWDESDPRFDDFFNWLEAGGTLLAADDPLPEEVPSQITNRQARQILLQYGLLDEVEDLVLASNNRELKIDFEFAENFLRNSNFVLSFSGLLGLSDAFVDQLFIEGSKK